MCAWDRWMTTVCGELYSCADVEMGAELVPVWGLRKSPSEERDMTEARLGERWLSLMKLVAVSEYCQATMVDAWQ